MTIFNLHKRTWRSIGLIMLVSVFIVPAFSQNARPSTNCSVGDRAPAFGFWNWHSDARVKVYILEHNFKSDEIPYLIKPLMLWDAEWESSGSGVRLEYAGLTDAPRQCQNCLTIMRERVLSKEKRIGGEFQAYSKQGTQLVMYGAILIDAAVTNPKALTSIIAHEIGHSLGLLDCYDCKDHSTVMTKLKRMNASNDMEGPSFCDVAQVREAYKQLRIRIGPAPVEMNALADEGEEPVEDDSPVVVPNQSMR
jgi:hypothetical protein